MAFHRQVQLDHPDGAVEVDEGLVPLIRALWDMGFDTRASCEHERGTPVGWIAFAAATDIERFAAMVGTDARIMLTEDLLPEEREAESFGAVGAVFFPAARLGDVTKRAVAAAAGAKAGEADASTTPADAIVKDVTMADLVAEAKASADFTAGMTMDIHDAESFLKAAVRAGRNHGPRMMFECFVAKRIGPDDMAAVVADVWTMAEWPQSHLGRETWTTLFRAAGYPPPKENLTLYRGSTVGRFRGMSWTTDRDKAQWFADRFAVLGPAHVYTVEAPPKAILAVMDDIPDAGREEHEVVVDPRLLPRVRRVPYEAKDTAT